VHVPEAGETERVLKLIAEDAVFLTRGAPPMRNSDFEIETSR
jgi:hypothetical protein